MPLFVNSLLIKVAVVFPVVRKVRGNMTGGVSPLELKHAGLLFLDSGRRIGVFFLKNKRESVWGLPMVTDLGS